MNLERQVLKASAFAAIPSVALALLLCACQSKPIPDSGFLQNPELMTKQDSLPVQRVWKDPNVKMTDYDKIIVKPIKTDMQLERTNREQRNIRHMMGFEKSDVEDLAKYTQDSFKKAIEKGPCRLKLTETPGPRTLILEMSFVKIVGAKPGVNAVKLALTCNPIGACFIPVKYAAKSMSDGPGQASLSIEGRLVDASNGHVVAMFAQHSKEPTALLNFEDFTVYGNLEQIVDGWAAKFVEIANKRPLETGEKVEAGSQLMFVNF